MDDIEKKLDEFIQKLKETGHRITAQRVAIARLALESIKAHPTFTDILNKAKASIPGVSASTIYNTLQLLEEMGFIQSFSVEGTTVYDSPHTHVNIVCTKTKRVYDLESESVEDLVKEFSKRINRRVRNIVVYAIC